MTNRPAAARAKQTDCPLGAYVGSSSTASAAAPVSLLADRSTATGRPGGVPAAAAITFAFQLSARTKCRPGGLPPPPPIPPPPSVAKTSENPSGEKHPLPLVDPLGVTRTGRSRPTIRRARRLPCGVGTDASSYLTAAT